MYVRGFLKTAFRAGGGVQLVERLPSMQWHPESGPQRHIKSGVVVHACKPSIQGFGVGDSEL